MKIIINEKPSVSQEFAKILKINREGKTDGYIEGISERDGNRYVITWCIGHLITLSYPEKYDPDLKKWNLSMLPFLPDEYKYEVIKNVAKQFKIVKDLFHRLDLEEILYAGDSGREGIYIQTLVREAAGRKKGIRERVVWIDSQTESEVLRGIRDAKEISEYKDLIDAAYMRAIEDYAMGINISRLLSCKFGNKFNAEIKSDKWKPISIGRVMTCVLGMVVRREREIRAFKETLFYKLEANCTGQGFKADWKAVDGSKYFESPLLYNESGFKEEKDAKELLAELSKRLELRVTAVDKTNKKKAAPLLYNLAELQADCTKKYKISPNKTLEIAQMLYERKLITYPRTDARVLTVAIANVIDKNLKGLMNKAYHGDISKEILEKGFYKKIGVTRYTDDNKVTDHYAIIPTGEGDVKGLNGLELNVYHEIVDRFLAIFLPNAVSEKTEIALQHHNGENFFASCQILIDPGYLKLSKEEIKESGPIIGYQVAVGDVIEAKFGIAVGKTQPPKRYTTGSMILAMENAGNLIEEEELRAQIKGSGIGTSATRAGIIEKLNKIGYIQTNKAQVIMPHEDGEKVFDIVKDTVPEFLDPKMTASWEKGLSQIENGLISKEIYKEKLYDYIKKIVEEVKKMNDGKNFDGVVETEKVGICPHCGGELVGSKYGVQCLNKCGMNFKYYGKPLPADQVKKLLQGESLKCKAQTKNGAKYNFSLTVKGVVPFSYQASTGEEKTGFQWDFEKTALDDNWNEPHILGKCPKCGGNINTGVFGVTCENGCGMSFGYYGTSFSAEQVEKLIKGESILLKMTPKDKKSSKYTIKLTPKGIVSNSYVNKNGEEKTGFQWDFEKTYTDSSGSEFGSTVLGKCPKCGSDVVNGRFGATCKDKCGMDFRFYGKILPDNQIKGLLMGKKILLNGKSKRTGNPYKQLVWVNGIEENRYTDKEGKEKNGFNWKFESEFVNDR